jgi:hypothetical protein
MLCRHASSLEGDILEHHVRLVVVDSIASPIRQAFTTQVPRLALALYLPQSPQLRVLCWSAAIATTSTVSRPGQLLSTEPLDM